MSTSNVTGRHGLTGRADSLWMATTASSDYPPLPANVTVDLAVLGGGIAGVTCAVLAKEAGLKVALIEANRIGRDVTGHTTAKITSLHRLIYKDLVDRFGEKLARQYAEANQAAIEQIALLISKWDIQCDFTRKAIFTYAISEKELTEIREENEAARSLELPSSFVSNVPLPFHNLGAVRFDNQAQFHPLKYLLALASTIPGQGSHICENTRALEIEDSEPCEIRTGEGTLRAENVIVATHYPVFDKSGLYLARLFSERSYVVAIKTTERFPDGMFSSADQYGYHFRSQPYEGGELILISGDGHKTGQGGDTVAHYRQLEEYARKIYSGASIEFRWSTQDNLTPDGVPYIGRLDPIHKHFYVATGFGTWGMTNGTVAGMLLTDLVQGKGHKWEDIYDPLRFKVDATSAKNLIADNLNALEQFVSGHLRSLPSLSTLMPGEGNVVKAGDNRAAAYKAEDGNVHLSSPTCAHIGCTVSWNSAEKTWDCPCHGSRYTFDGKVIHGPANRDLGPVEEKEQE